MKTTRLVALIGFAVVSQGVPARADAETRHVWEKVEMTLESQRSYENPYTDVEVWGDLKGPGFAKRCCGFWDGGSIFRVRVLATTPGRWVWKSGASAADPGLQGLQGEFTAVPWTETELAENPCLCLAKTPSERTGTRDASRVTLFESEVER